MGDIYKRGRVWWAYWIDGRGKRHRRSCQTRDQRVARERLRDFETGDAPAPRHRPQALSVAIDQMITSLHDKAEATKEMYREKKRTILANAGDPDVRDINRTWLDTYASDRASDGAARHTVKKELITIRRALKHAHAHGRLLALPSFPEFSPRYVPRKVWLTTDEFALVLDELPRHRRLWACLAAMAGLRLGEIERVGAEHIRDGILHVPGTKTDASARPVPIVAELAAEIEAGKIGRAHV